MFTDTLPEYTHGIIFSATLPGNISENIIPLDDIWSNKGKGMLVGNSYSQVLSRGCRWWYVSLDEIGLRRGYWALEGREKGYWGEYC